MNVLNFNKMIYSPNWFENEKSFNYFLNENEITGVITSECDFQGQNIEL